MVDLSSRQRTIDKVITDCFEQIVYSINQPTGARNFQSVFWNISYYDKYYFESIFGDFYFPDGTKPSWPAVSWLQKRFMRWFNQERTKTVLTFPVETMALLTKDGDVIDKEYADFTAQMYSEGHSFFTYMSDNADSLASCCRNRRLCGPVQISAARALPLTFDISILNTPPFWGAASSVFIGVSVPVRAQCLPACSPFVRARRDSGT